MVWKKNLLLIALVTFFAGKLAAQKEKDFATNWQRVAAFEKKGLTKSALKEVLVIYNAAVKTKNDAQQVKSSIYQVKYRQMIEEDSRETNIFYIDTLIQKASQPAKRILQSMQAEMFWQYLQTNRYKFYNRTNVVDEKATDISTWSLEKLHSTISSLYLASVENAKLLQQTKLNSYDAIIIKGENTRQLRPTLYDFLAHRALAYFSNDERNLIRPAYHFTIDQAEIFAPVQEFVKAKFITKDAASLQHKAVLLMQDLLDFHLQDTRKDALLDADLARLNFANEYSVLPDKSNLYEEALLKLEKTYAGNYGVAQAMYLRANNLFQRGQQYVPLTKTANQFDIQKAVEICQEAIKKYPGSDGAANCQNLVNQVQQPSLSLETESVNLIGQPFRTLVKYKNVPTVYFRVIKITRQAMLSMDRRNEDKYWKELVGLKPTTSWEIALPDMKDYQSHGAEVKIDALPAGTYIVLASIDRSFSLQKNILAKQFTHVSNISYIHTNSNEYYVLHRENGQPIYSANVQVWETKYNYSKNSNEEIKAENYITDKNGFFKLKQQAEYRSFTLQVKSSGDELFLQENNYYNVFNSYVEPTRPASFLFTDRSIYRPGQVVYFKGIVINRSKTAKQSVVMPAHTSTIQLKDANGQNLQELKLTTNDFGSFHASFKLPEGVLNGQFSLYDSSTNSSQYFNVEEYKRPKFLVEIKKPEGTYRLLDSIKITGSAKAFAGNFVDGAAVKYRVVRKVRYQPWWYTNYSRGSKRIYPPGRTDEQEITNGETSINVSGEFTIVFKALPDETIDKKDQPTFYYEVNADVTDLNGETRSGTTSVAVAYQQLQLEIMLPAKITLDSLGSIKIKSTNLNEIEERAFVTVTAEKLKEPTKIFRSRYWEQADQFTMSREEYYRLFPYDIYKDENDPKNYEVEKTVFDKTDSSNNSWQLETKGWRAGWYKIVAVTKDKSGEEVRAEKYILVTDATASQVNEPVIFEVKNSEAEPGKKIQYTISSGFKNIWLIHSLTRMDKQALTSYENISSKPLSKELNVTEEDRGGISVSYAFIQHNRVYAGNESFSVPWSNKNLNVQYETFRDKLLPGTEEQLKVKIIGNKGEKIAAEMLVSMYDASLDQFRAHSWSPLDIWPSLTDAVNWMSNGFNAVNSEELHRYDWKYVDLKPKSYDRLLGSGYGGFNEVVVVGYGATKRKDLIGATARALQGRVAGIAVESKAEEDQAMDSGNANSVSSMPPLAQKGQESVQVRKNFNETAFFYPDLQTDESGNISFRFTIPEALTQWKLLTFAHTKELASGYIAKSIATQKPLMVQPNAPRFLREGDRMEFSAKVVNLGEKEVTGTAQLELLDAATGKPVDGWFKNVFPNQYFTIAPGQSAAVKFPMEVPFNFSSALTYRIIARADNFSDGEEMAIPVLTNRTLVTETLPLNMGNDLTKNFIFQKLINSSESNSIMHHALTVEYSSNPSWYAVQALPYLMEYPYECAEQVFNRFYANTLASSISNSIPAIKAVFEKWKYADTVALLSNLQKNQELKSALLKETPWVMDAMNESQQKKNIAVLFDLVRVAAESEKAITQLKEAQSPNGGFVWFKGGPDDRYITQYILSGVGHLKKLKAFNADAKQDQQLKSVIDKALPYLDKKLAEDYAQLVKSKVNMNNNHLNPIVIQYLYMRSFFPEYNVASSARSAFEFYRNQSKKYWLNNTKNLQAMIALSAIRSNDRPTAVSIIKSLKENAIHHDELGMYWKEWTTSGYFWHQAPIESQALMIEAFTETSQDEETINELKTWLLKQKQTQKWRTTRATADACYALLMGNSTLQNTSTVQIRLGDKSFSSLAEKAEAGTGYFKQTIPGNQVTPSMGNVQVQVQPQGSSTLKSSWGAVYWQYFEDLDKASSAATPLKLEKKLFVVENSDRGPQLREIGANEELKVGDKVTVRILLKVDRDMEYLHMKDMRAASMEPVNVLSSYKFQGGLGYYEATSDASTNFFFSQLRRGSYVFEYNLFVGLPGNFSNGITTIQSMYAPEFSSHSEGIRVSVK
ncbi:MAG: alpha-2-macroglobulin family protein [Bacteroidota bacterium]